MDRQKPHPAPEELLDYHHGDLAEADRERIQDHLVLCEACSRTVLDLDSFPDVEPVREADRLSEFELAADWKRFRERAFAKPVRPRFPWAVAASLLVAALGVTWGARQSQQVRELSGPRADVFVADLVPLGSEVRGPEAGEVVRVPAWADRVLLLLNLARGGAHPEYEVRVLAPDGREVWRRGGLRPSPDGTFALEVPADLLEGGAHRIRLLGGGETVAEYGVRLQRK